MGYAGYVPTPGPPVLTEFQKALKSIPELSSLEIIGKLIYNIACAPKEPKYRSVKLSNPKIKALIVDTPGAMEAMHILGWELLEDNGEQILNCPKTLAMAQFKDVEAAKDALRKDMRREQVAALKTSTSTGKIAD